MGGLGKQISCHNVHTLPFTHQASRDQVPAPSFQDAGAQVLALNFQDAQVFVLSF